MIKQTLNRAAVGIALVAATLATPALAFAEDVTPKPASRPGWEERCQNIETRIETKIAKFHNNKERHVNGYKKAAERLQNLADKLDARGYDTSQVRADYQTLNQKILKFAQDYANFIAQLEETQQHACGQSEGAFKQALAEARDALKVVREDSLDIRNFYQTVVRPHVLDLKNQTPNASPSPASE